MPLWSAGVPEGGEGFLDVAAENPREIHFVGHCHEFHCPTTPFQNHGRKGPGKLEDLRMRRLLQTLAELEVVVWIVMAAVVAFILMFGWHLQTFVRAALGHQHDG
jgi:hypothetical protein